MEKRDRQLERAWHLFRTSELQNSETHNIRVAAELIGGREPRTCAEIRLRDALAPDMPRTAQLARLLHVARPPKARQYSGQYFTPWIMAATLAGFIQDIWFTRHPIEYGDLGVIDTAAGCGVLLDAFRTMFDMRIAMGWYDRPQNLKLIGLERDLLVVECVERAGIDLNLQSVECGLAWRDTEALDIAYINPPFDTGLETQFVLHALDLVRPRGMVAAILPNGILSNKKYLQFRRTIIEEHTLLAVVSLPDWTFSNAGTNIKTSLIVVERATSDLNHNVLMVAAHDEKDYKELAQGLGDAVRKYKTELV